MKEAINTPLPSTITKDALAFKPFFEEATKYIPSFSFANEVKSAKVLALIASPENFKAKLAEVDKKFDLNASKALETSSFKGKAGETFSTFTMKDNITKISLFIFDTTIEYDVRNAQELGAKISAKFNAEGDSEIVLSFALEHEKCNCMISNICYGLALRNYRFDRYFEAKKEGKGAKLKTVEVLNSDASLKLKIDEKLEIAKHICLVRDLVNCPPMDINPDSYSKIIEKGFEGINVKVKILEEAEMVKLGMHSLLAVGHGSVNRSRTVVMEYMGNPDSKEVDFAMIGKGVCFDSGGYSIKPASGMEDMKCDMAGSAVAFGTLRLIAKMGLKINAVASVGLVENLISGAAYKPGDVLRSMSGQTIEMLNTDAEGRLVLADVLYYTQKNYQPKYMVDLATLTGAVTIALGDVYAGLMYNDPEIAEKIEAASVKTGELVWRLPFRKEFDDMINSSLADMKNIGNGRGAGTITAGQFLKRFVNYEKGWNAKWAHLDIAGVAFDGKGGADPKVAKGGTGWGVGLLYRMAKNFK